LIFMGEEYLMRITKVGTSAGYPGPPDFHA